MGCGASSNITTELDAVARSLISGAGIAAFVVSGAGVEKVNGTYQRQGHSLHEGNGAPVFVNGTVWLVLYDGSWFLAEADKLALQAGDYYRVDPDQQGLPGADWETVFDGVDPPPKLTPVEEGPAAFVVEGAGRKQVNGRFTRRGMYEGSPLYENGQLWLVRLRANLYAWCIVDKYKINEAAGDLYTCATPSDYPPLRGWTLMHDGVARAPVLSAVDAQGRLLRHGWFPEEFVGPSVDVPVVTATFSVVTPTGTPVEAVAMCA